MTKQEIIKAYDVNEQGVITSPGKFEGEMLYVPYFWDHVMSGMGESFPDDNGTQTEAFCIIPEDAEEFTELADDVGRYLYLWEDSQGFIHTEMD